MLSVLHAGRQMKTLRFVFVLCVLSFVCCFLVPSPVRAQSNAGITTPPTLDVSSPTNTLYRNNYWATIQVTISHVSTPLSGLLVAQMCNFITRGSTQIGILSPWRYQLPVHLNTGAQKQFSLPLPHTMGNFDPQGVLLTLLDAHGTVLTSTTIGRGYEVVPPDILIGTLSDQSAHLSTALMHANLPNQKDSPTTVPLDATTFPTQSSLLSLYDVLILDDFSTRTLSQAQLLALRTWVNQGGTLIEIGGSQWQRTLGSLPPDLLPVSLSGTQSLPAKTPLYPFIAPSSPDFYVVQSNQSPHTITVSTALLSSRSFSSNEALLSSGSLPLLVKARLGQGSLCYLAYDPMQTPLLSWEGQDGLWEMLLFSTLGDHFLIPDTATARSTGPGDFLIHVGIMRFLTPEALLGPWILVLLLFAYVLVLGPIRLLLLRRLHLAYHWHWRIILSSILLFSLIGYSFAFYQKNQEVSDNTVSLVRLNQDGSSASVTTYHGFLLPSNAPFTIQLPAGNLAQPLSNRLLTYARLSQVNSESPFSLTYNRTETSVQMSNSTPWLLHPLVAEYDTSLPGQITASLSLEHGRMVGKVTNTLSTALSDLYVLFPHGFARIGTLAAGESRTVDLELALTPASSQSSLADQIAQKAGLPTPYFPYASNGTPQNDFERHMALLSALSGTGTTLAQCNRPCTRNAITTPGTIYFTDAHIPNPGQVELPDPLLLSGAPATLIGWLDQAALPDNKVTVNHTVHPQGQHENFLQMPLSIGISTLDRMPAHFVQGQVITIGGFDAQLVLPGVYTLSDGNLTFELSLPHTLPKPGGLTISIPNLLASPRGLNRYTNPTHLQVRLYNWLTKQWDTVQLQYNTFSSRNTAAYLGKDQHVLVHISSNVNNAGRLIFGAPSLSLQP
ncbi:MAG TPA: hypothetical protein VL485_17610 [Ktedonobacteraceae bacterium]|nr:hypothetical protein [Ktedonobacteraceae bacterium]